MTDATAAQPFTEDETRTFAAIADMVIPANIEYGVPGAGDPLVVAEILIDAERHRARLRAALDNLNAMAQDRHGLAFVDLTATQRKGITETFRESHAGAANLIANLTTQAYYRDDRVMLSLGMEPRPPHPLGFSVEQGDWSLLDPVRERESFFRKAD